MEFASLEDRLVQKRQDPPTTPPGGTTTPPGGIATTPSGAANPSGGTNPPFSGATPPSITTGLPGGTRPSGGSTNPGSTIPPGSTATPSGGATAPPSGSSLPGGAAAPPGGTTAPPDSGSTSSPGGTTTPPVGGTAAPSNGHITFSGGATPPIGSATAPGGDRGSTSHPIPPTWAVSSTWWQAPAGTEAAIATNLAAQPAWTGTTVYEGNTWVQSTVQKAFTTVYSSALVISSDGVERTTSVPMTVVIPPGTVVINHDLSSTKKNDRVLILAGALGGVAGIIVVGLIILFALRRRRRHLQPFDSLSEIDPGSPSASTRDGRAVASSPFDDRAPPSGSPAMSEVGRMDTGIGGFPIAGGLGSSGSDGGADPQKRRLVLHNPSSQFYTTRPSYDGEHLTSDESSMYTSVQHHTNNDIFATTTPQLGYLAEHQRTSSETSGMSNSDTYLQQHRNSNQRLLTPPAYHNADYTSKTQGGNRLGPFHDGQPENPFIGSEIGRLGHGGVIVHEDGGSVIDLMGENRVAHYPPAYHAAP